jgi:hypothetical protein
MAVHWSPIEGMMSFGASRKGFRFMNAKSRAAIGLASLTIAVALALLIVEGCALDKNENRPGNVFTRIGGHSGQLIEPKRCLLKVAILSRPFGDPAINELVWRVADEQIIPPDERRAWEVNGLRVGRIAGDLPMELESILKETAPQKKVTPTNFFVDSGEPTLIVVSAAVEQASLILNRENRIVGNDYRDASGFFRVTPQHDGINNVSLRMVPEIHHGPIQRTFQALPTAAPIGPQEFMINNGQQEETIRELATTLVLEPGQVAVIGSRPEFKRSLGNFMLTQAVAHSDQRVEKLIMIWASRNLAGQGDKEGNSNLADRPTLLKRLMSAPPASATARPAPPAPEVPSIDTSVPTIASSTASAATGATPSASPSPAKPNSAEAPTKAPTAGTNDQPP